MSGNTQITEGVLLGLGNPLLDISASVNSQFLEKYELKKNDQILASEKHEDLYDNMVKEFEVQYIPGGATQNSIRVAQWMLKHPHATTITGCIGHDNYGKILEQIMKKDGVRAVYRYADDVRTGTCAVCITNESGADVSLRSLVAYLGAANHFSIDHLQVLRAQNLISKARVYYMAGFPLTVCPDAMLEIAKQACQDNKIVAMNLSAPFICSFFMEALMKMLPYVDYLFGNEDEFAAFAETSKIESTDLKVIGKHISKLPKENKARKRMVLMTQGHLPCYVIKGDQVQQFPTLAIKAEDIVDTNGAGDSFVGGFLAGLVNGCPLEKCMEAANYSAHYILKMSGVQLPTESTFVF